jgi:hypothetical protein
MESEMDQAARKERTRELRLKGQAKQMGLWMQKSRARGRLLTPDNRGQYKLTDSYRNICLAGSHFELSLDDVEKWLAEYASKSGGAVS